MIKSNTVHLISLGAGVQSSVLALMAAMGEIRPMPVAAIFADTQAEPQSVYNWLAWLETQLPFPVYRVGKGDLGKVAVTMRKTKDGRLFSKSDIPVYTLNADGSHGMVPNRSCTMDFKIGPIMKKARELGEIKRGQKKVGVVQWIGISLDEAHRMKPSRHAWAESRWPLIELGMKRRDCLAWMRDRGYPQPPRSSCIFCPYHSDREWRRLKTQEPKEFAKAVAFEKALQHAKGKSQNFCSTPFLHASRTPLDEVDFSTDVDRGQLVFGGWGNECEGMCGV